MATFHDQFITLRNQLGYRQNNFADGSCAHYAEKGIDAWLLGADDYAAFLRRRTFIKTHGHALAMTIATARNKTKKKQVLSPHEQQAMDVAVFMDGDLYQEPNKYREFLGKNVSTTQVPFISLFAQPEDLRVQGGRSLLLSAGGVYTKTELETYIKLLDDHAQKIECDFALSLGSDNHRIALCYSVQNKSWTLIDANDENPTANTNLKGYKLAGRLLKIFEYSSQATMTGFDTYLYSRANTQKNMQPIIDDLIRSDTFQRLHSITAERATKTNSRRCNLAWFAAKRRGRATLTALAKLAVKTGNMSYLNTPNNIGNTPGFIAVLYGHADCLNILVEAKADLSHANNDGVTPAFIAAQEGHAECLKILIAAKADIRRANNEGATLAYIAAQNGHADCLKILIEAKADITSARKDDFPPAYIAAKYGHADCLKVLAGKVDFNALHKNGDSCARIAISNGHVAALAILLEHGADLNVSYRGRKITEYAKDPKMIKFLKDWEEKEKIKQAETYSPFYYWCNQQL